MKQIVTYCEKTEEKTQTTITEIEATLKKQLKKHDYAEIQNTIKVNETATKQTLYQRKFKKFYQLKYKPKATVKTTNFTEGNELLEKSPATARPTNAEILNPKKNPSIRTSKTNLNNYKTNKHTLKIIFTKPNNSNTQTKKHPIEKQFKYQHGKR